MSAEDKPQRRSALEQLCIALEVLDGLYNGLLLVQYGNAGAEGVADDGDIFTL